jgi:hypothetical protein
MAFTREQQAAIDDATSRLEQSQQPVESQRLRSAAQGLTFGFSDEIEAYIRSLGGSGPQYEAIRDDIRRKLSAYQESNPTASIGYETLGALAPTALSLLSGVGAGAGAGNIARLTGQAGTLARRGTNVIPQAATLGGRLPRIGRGAALGATYGGLYGMGTAEGSFDERLEQAREFAGTGSLFGLGAQAVAGPLRFVGGLALRPISQRLRNVKGPKDLSDIQKTIHDHTEYVYKQLDTYDNNLNSSTLNAALNDLKQEATAKFNYQRDLPRSSSALQDLTTDGFQDMEAIIRRGQRKDIPQSLSDNLDQTRKKINQLSKQGINNKNLKEISRLKQTEENILKQIDAIPEQGISLKDLQQLKIRLNKLYKASTRGSSAEQPMLLAMGNKIDDVVKNMGDGSEIWKTAKNLYRVEQNMERIERAFDKAKRQAQAGVNVDEVSYYKRMANNLLNSSDAGFFNDDEIALLRQFVEGNLVDNMLRQLGTYAPSSGNFMRLMAVGGAFASNGATIPFTILSQLAKTTSNERMRNNANDLVKEMLKANPKVLEEIGLTARELNLPAYTATSGLNRNIIQRSSGPTVGTINELMNPQQEFTPEQEAAIADATARLGQ